MKAYKYRIYPTKSQQKLLLKHFGCCRFVYNWGLGVSKEKYDGCYNLCKKLTQFKKENIWLYEAPNQSLQQSLRCLDTAFQNFFKHKRGYPKFKNKIGIQKIHYNQNIGILDNKVKIPKIGYIKCVVDRQCKGNIKNMTIIKTSSGKYYVSITTDCAERKPSGVGEVGIDMGLKEFAILSNGTVYHNPKCFEKSQKKLKKLQRQMCRKKKGSSNRNKLRIRLAKQCEKVKNQNLDFQHKVSREIANQFGLVAIENLNVNGMMKNHNLSKSIQNASWSQFKNLLMYKTKVIEIDRFEPSSKKCSNCGNVKKYLSLKERTYHCDVCGYTEDRDINAAKNILAAAKNKL